MFFYLCKCCFVRIIFDLYRKTLINFSSSTETHVILGLLTTCNVSTCYSHELMVIKSKIVLINGVTYVETRFRRLSVFCCTLRCSCKYGIPRACLTS